jgi:hypothetical protein
MRLRRGHTKKHSHKSRKHGGGKFVGGKRSKTSKRRHSHKRYLGGDNALNQAYTGSPITTVANPNMAFLESNSRAYPATDPAPIVPSYMNSQAMSRGGRKGTRRIRLRGGGCGCGSPLTGGGYIPALIPAMQGTPVNGGDISTWPGVNGIASGAANYPHYALNTYEPNDVSRQMVATGAQPPFSTGGTRRGGRKHRKRTGKRGGGFLSTFVPEYSLNAARGVVHTGANTLDGILGNPAGADPAPWVQNNIQTSAYKAMYNPII